MQTVFFCSKLAQLKVVVPKISLYEIATEWQVCFKKILEINSL